MLTVFRKEWLSFLRDKHSFLTYLLMPMVLIGILGTALSGAFSDDGGINPVKLSITNEDRGAFSHQLITVLKGEKLSDVFTMVHHDEDVKLTIPNGYSESLMQQMASKEKDDSRLSKLTIKTDHPDAIAVSVLKQVTAEFSNSVVQHSIQKKAVPVSVDQPVKIPVQTLSANHKNPSAFQYYAIGMGVMYLLFMGIGGTKALLEEINHRTLQRLSMTSKPMWQIIIGKFLGWTVLGICQFLILMIGTHYIYGVDWGSSYAALGGLLLAYVWAVTSLGMLLAAFITNQRAADMAGNFGVYIAAAAGGSMLPIYLFPDFLDQVDKIMPNSWALRGFLQVLNGGGFQAVAENIVVLAGMGILFFILAAWRLQSRVGVN